MQRSWPISPPQLQARCYAGSGAEHHEAGAPGLRQALQALLLTLETSAQSPGSRVSAPAPQAAWDVAAFTVVCFFCCPRSKGAGRGFLPCTASLASSPPLPVPSSSFLRSQSELLGGRNPRVMDRLAPKDTRASQPCVGEVKRMPDPYPEPACTSLGVGEQPLLPPEGKSFHSSTEVWGLAP